MKRFLATLGVLFLISGMCVRLSAQEYLPRWQEGYLDVHSISTGQGESTYIMMPDGTTMVVDAGDKKEQWSKTHYPDASKTPGEWIAHYIKHFSSPLPHPGKVDYFLLSHFHSDHIGVSNDCGYFDLVNNVTFAKIIDRGWPDYDFPSKEKNLKSCSVLNDYISAVQKQVKDGSVAEQFEIGSRKQIALRYAPRKYDFEVYNVAANARRHAGKGNKTVQMWPDSVDVAAYDENVFSCVFTIRYGKFKYYMGGDLAGNTDPRKDVRPRDMQTQVAPLVGPVTAMKADHHGFKDSSMPVFLWTLRPDVIVVHCFQRNHPVATTVKRYIDPVYPGRRDLYITGETSRGRLGEELWSHFKPHGHVVLRVYENGSSYQVFVLDPSSRDYKVIYKSEIYNL